MIIDLFLILLAAYAVIGLIFGLYFALKGATRLDPHMRETPKAVRLLLLPGVAATWPFLLRKLVRTAE